MATLSRMRGVGPGSGFWIVAVVFVVTMAYSTVPTPLYPLYEQRDDFPVSLVTVIYSAFAVGVDAQPVSVRPCQRLARPPHDAA